MTHHTIKVWHDFWIEILAYEGQIDNRLSAQEFGVGDIITFVDFKKPSNIIERQVTCKLADSSYSFMTKRFDALLCSVKKQKPYHTHCRAKALELDARAKSRRKLKAKPRG